MTEGSLLVGRETRRSTGRGSKSSARLDTPRQPSPQNALALTAQSGQHIGYSNLKIAQEIHRKLIKPPDDLLGKGNYVRVERVEHKSVHLARKHIRPPRWITYEDIIKESDVMKKLVHEHVVQLVGTYQLRKNDLYILIWPVAVCSLDALIHDLDDLRNNQGDPIDIEARLQTLGVGNLGLVQDHAEAAHHEVTDEACPFNFLQRIMGCIARAVAHCHASSVRHLDLKPKNILLNPDRVYLADFGISKDTSDRDNTNTLNPNLGTQKWKAPEATSLSLEWSMKAADVYSLGLVYVDIFSIVCRVRRQDFEEVYDDDISVRTKNLAAYQERLVKEALATQRYEDDKAGTLNAKHIVGLTTKMLSEPSTRPDAEEVDRELARLGGLDQIYHGRCCRRKGRDLRQLFNGTFSRIAAERNQLKEEVGGLKKRLETLQGAEETYLEREKKERDNHKRNFEILKNQFQTQLVEEQKKVQALQQEVEQLRKGANRRGPRQPAVASKAERGATPVGLGLDNFESLHRRKSSRNNNPTSPTAAHILATVEIPNTIRHAARPGGARFVSESAVPAPTRMTPSPNPPTPTGLGGYPMKKCGSASRLPVPAHPTTPIRSGTPVGSPLPARLPRDATDSTQSSLTSSIFSIRSAGQESNPTPLNGSPAVRQAVFSRPPIIRPSPVAPAPQAPSSPTASTHSEHPTTIPSTVSSPRTARSELVNGESEGGSIVGDMLYTGAVPSLQPAKSWAAVAGDTQGLAKMIGSMPAKTKPVAPRRRPPHA